MITNETHLHGKQENDKGNRTNVFEHEKWSGKL